MVDGAAIAHPPVETLSLAELADACQQNTRQYRRSEPSDTRYCLEIFQRALTLASAANGAHPDMAAPGTGVPAYADEAARAMLTHLYTDYIKAQISPLALRTTSVDDLVQQVWLRFWRAANHGLIFTSLEGALTYLKQTVISTLIEAQRREFKRARDVSLHDLDLQTESLFADPKTDLFEQHTRQRFYQRCREVLTDPFEYRLFRLRYDAALPPREIARHLAEEGALIKGRAPTARLVSDTLERVCKRLCLDPEIRDLLAGE